MHLEMRIRLLREELRILAALSAVRFRRPREQAVTGEERACDRRTVGTPQELSSHQIAKAAHQELPLDEWKRVVEPDEGVRLRPDKIARKAIVAVCDPPFDPKRVLHTPTEDLGRRRFPVGLPE